MEGGLVASLLTTVQTNVLAEVGTALPAAGAVMAAIAGIYIGVKIFKNVSGART